MSTPLFLLALLSVLVNIVLSILIVHELRKRGVKINYFLIKLLLPRYAHQYKQITMAENGAVGGIFYGWLISINAALVFAVAGLIVRAI